MFAIIAIPRMCPKRARFFGGLPLLGLLSLLAAGCIADRIDGDGDGDGDMSEMDPDKVVAPPVFGPGADPGTVGVFGGPPGGAAPQIVYPFDGVMLAKNINQMRLAFLAAPGHSLFRVTLDSPRYRQTIYLGGAACQGRECSYLVDDRVWNAIAQASGGRATLSIDGTAGAGQPVGTAMLSLSFSPKDVRGGLYYFSTSQAGLLRVPFGATKPVPYLLGTGSGGVKNCIGCHGVSRDGKKVAAVFNLPDGYAGIVDGADPKKYILEPIESDGARLWNFASFSPDGSRMITVWNGTLSLRDGTTGKLIKNVPGAMLGGRAAMPEWSPDGESIVFVRVSGRGRLGSDFGSPDIKAGDWFLGDAGDIAVLPYNGGAFGPAVTIVPAIAAKEFHFYPTFSPDSGWILFNSAATPGCASDSAGKKTGFNLRLVNCVSYDQTAARLRLVRARPGQTPIELPRAAHAPNKTTAWPKFAPFQQGSLVFFTFSAKLDYGFVIKQAEVQASEDSYRPQIWMSGIDLSRAAAGEDASYPPFWLPFQDAETNNHGAQWTQELACSRPGDCGSEFNCIDGVCVPIIG
jgi:hypothetical protein